jgi:hypothetical protein
MIIEARDCVPGSTGDFSQELSIPTAASATGSWSKTISLQKAREGVLASVHYILLRVSQKIVAKKMPRIGISCHSPSNQSCQSAQYFFRFGPRSRVQIQIPEGCLVGLMVITPYPADGAHLVVNLLAQKAAIRSMTQNIAMMPMA